MREKRIENCDLGRCRQVKVLFNIVRVTDGNVSQQRYLSKLAATPRTKNQ